MKKLENKAKLSFELDPLSHAGRLITPISKNLSEDLVHL